MPKLKGVILKSFDLSSSIDPSSGDSASAYGTDSDSGVDEKEEMNKRTNTLQDK